MGMKHKPVYIVKCEYKATGFINTFIDIEGVFASKEDAYRFIDECKESEKDLPEHKKARYWTTTSTFYEYE